MEGERMKVLGYVDMHISDSHVPCLKCGEDVATKSIDNLTEIMPDEYTIIVETEQCKCGFVTVLEYVCNDKYSLDMSIERTNEALREQGSNTTILAYTSSKTKFFADSGAEGRLLTKEEVIE
jgi:hypothetical protein